jgi:Ni/Co efflux regulator RcnB
MQRIKLVLALSAVMVAMLVATAGPAMAGHTSRHENRQERQENRQERWDDRWDRWENHHADLFDNGFVFGSPFINVIEEVDTQNVRERNPLDGDCVVEDIDLDGWIAEWEIICYV